MVFIPAENSDFRFRRSVLFMPTTNARALEKAPTLPCDCVIFDLEDAIEGEGRDKAHANLKSHVAGVDFGSRERIVRIGGNEDMDAAIACSPDVILVPKVESPAQLVGVGNRLGKEIDTRLWAMIETPGGLMNLAGIIAATPRLSGLVVGPNDLAASTGVKPGPNRENLRPWLMTVIAAARSRGFCVIDGVYNNFRDEAGFEAECRQAADMGFDGKTLIHPSQIAAANEAFGPGEAELERARTIVEAFSLPKNSDRGVIQLDGEMLERLHLRRAQVLLDFMEKNQ